MCGIRKPMWWGYKAEKKFDDILIRFDTMCDRRTRCRSKDRASTALRG